VLLGGEERISLLRDSIIPSGLIERVNPEKRSDNQINTTLNNQLILTNFTLANYDNYYVDRETGLPEIKEYLQLDSTKSINIPSAVFSQISGEDIDVVLEYQKGTIPVAATEIYLDFFNSTDNQRLQHTVQIGNPSRLRSIFTTSSDTTQRFRDMILGIDDRSISLTLSLFERGNVTINSGIQLRQFQNGEATGSNSGSFGSQDLPIVWSNFTANSLSGDMKFISLTIIERNGQRFNQKSMLRKWDNSFLSTKFDLNPGDQIIAHYNSNGSSYSEDGTDVLLREYVTDDGTTDATVTGFTGATSALELADLLTNVANINTLR
jgi:predicted secreted protein